jgi:polysaccharide biosynthesis/export protein
MSLMLKTMWTLVLVLFPVSFAIAQAPKLPTGLDAPLIQDKAAVPAVPPGSAVEPGPPPKKRGVADDYRIGEGDVVQISVWRQPEASVESAVVRTDGKVSMPLIKEIQIAGMTPIQAENAVREQMSAFINVPDVAVVVKETNSKKVYVVGGVGRVGPLPYTYRMTVLQALSEAGGLAEFAKRGKIYVLRTQDGKTVKLPFKYNDVLKGKHMELNIQLQPGDTIVVPI